MKHYVLLGAIDLPTHPPISPMSPFPEPPPPKVRGP